MTALRLLFLAYPTSTMIVLRLLFQSYPTSTMTALRLKERKEGPAPEDERSALQSQRHEVSASETWPLPSPQQEPIGGRASEAQLHMGPQAREPEGGRGLREEGTMRGGDMTAENRKRKTETEREREIMITRVIGERF